MKKFISLAIALLALPFVMTSCSDEDDLPNVDYTITVSGGVIDQNTGVIYVAQGQTLSIESLEVRNMDSSKPAALTSAEYYWDYDFLGNSPVPPFGFDIYIDPATPTGEHQLTIRTGVVAVDKEPAVGIVGYTVVVVPQEEDVPETATSATITSVPGLKIK